jgi:hypothetical protein
MTETLITNILEDISYQPDLPALMKRLRVKENGPFVADLAQLVAEASQLAHPRALYQVAFISGRGEDYVEIEGLRFDSRVLAGNFASTYRVFPYLATCGQELNEWAHGIEDMVLSYWAEAIKEQVLYAALKALLKHLQMQYGPGETASMSPGSLADWPIQQQKVLFDLFQLHSQTIGVQLTDSMLMIPNKSVSGIRFANHDHFESCQLCPREGCPGRRAVYDAELYDQKYCAHAG